MCRIFPRRTITIMTIAAYSLYLVVIDANRRHPLTGTMTTLAVIRCRNMARSLALELHPVMTGKTSSDDLRVIHSHRRCPDCRTMAGTTIVGRIDMLRGFLIQMTGTATADDLIMIDDQGVPDPPIGAMTGLTGIGGTDMRRPLAACALAVVTDDTIPNDPLMIKGVISPGLVGLMTKIAFLCGDDVIRSLTDRQYVVMTTTTGTDGLRMVNPEWRHRPRHTGVMTGFAIARRGDVASIFTRRQ